VEVTRAALLDRARQLVEPLRARAAQTEALRHLPEESVEAIVAAQLMRIATPKKFGGLGVPYETMLEAAVILASGCGSAGWCYAMWAVDSWLTGWFPLAAQEDIFASGPDGPDTGGASDRGVRWRSRATWKASAPPSSVTPVRRRCHYRGKE
jgi:alkylation response protein AidB-like acyl-CoA dehydrogenase